MDRPTEDGWYWFQGKYNFPHGGGSCDMELAVVEVSFSKGRGFVYESGSDVTCLLDNFEGKWSSRIEPPEESELG